MKTIPVGELVALVDDEDLDRLAMSRWFPTWRRGTFYARRNASSGRGRNTTEYMHRVILGVPPGVKVDHVDGDGLNNRRANLRRATSAENARNGRAHGGKHSRFKGVTSTTRHARPGHRYWIAQITVDGRNIKRHAASELDAAQLYNDLARKYFGEFARLNDVPRGGDVVTG